MSERSSRADHVYRLLRQAIIEQALKPGVKLSEDTIADQFKVSRTSVRGALVRLNAEGLVDLKANKGASVAEPTIEEAKDIFSLRFMLETEVVRRLVTCFDEIHATRLEAHVREEEGALKSDGPTSIRLAGEFHILLAELTGSLALTRFVREVVSRSSLILARFARLHSPECAVEEHVQIIRALRSGKVAEAENIMLEHLHAVELRAELGFQTSDPDTAAILRHYAGSNRH
ncbi:DNA-binding GntR family transcriptional regulator [Pararhizobium capsulatum DSM 1112]|uniref:DNA-binding GntR family transcriptional regulator n=1 Tax=Pararhizobium capsulatum DSM 1112 TaxID=1121113 RepID=A0ABU0C1H2_9HYPH|nr:GntR family transcriptional regulator [Pararhizobium capsulatum]MDQ0323751.1 DNA-binding GntR family transcriptional regulator [Pararhizobium capsulatum DSM 1112]